MTVSTQEDARPAEQSGGDYDVVIIGAGISGIGAAYRIAEADPATRYVILERRNRIGGTWDLFRYPGVRSDSSIFTLSWPWEPWAGKEYVADGDVFEAISDGSLEIVTDQIDRLDETGITCASGRHVDADIIVKATGLNLLALGGVQISVDGMEVKPQERFSYKAHMLEDVPNLIWCIGYTNASWTLRADITARATVKLMRYMKANGYTHAYPHPSGGPMSEKPTWDIQAGYVLRNAHALPKSATKRPWVVRQDFLADTLDYRFRDRIEEDMVFGRVRTQAQLIG